MIKICLYTSKHNFNFVTRKRYKILKYKFVYNTLMMRFIKLRHLYLLRVKKLTELQVLEFETSHFLFHYKIFKYNQTKIEYFIEIS